LIIWGETYHLEELVSMNYVEELNATDDKDIFEKCINAIGEKRGFEMSFH
jgi:hypothetical protein